jgi:plasmid stabilization system protein ParE
MIRYAAEALDDVERLYRWLLDRDAAAAGNWLTRLQEAEALIARAPHRWPSSAGGAARRYIMRFGRSRYVIHFVEDGTDAVILRIWSGREQRP